MAQYDHEHVFKDLTGNDLRNAIINDFKPVNFLSYSAAREKLYTEVYNESDTVKGIYTEYGKFLNPSSIDPISDLLQGYGINAEHTYPQSKGADFGNPRSDMHHIYPCRAAVNTARGSNQFGEINDKQTTAWYYLDGQMSGIPPAGVDNYSESTSNRFEPREDHKGNVARAMLYFYTMYQTQADNADPNFFWSQVDQLCDLHSLDPVDSLEWARSFMIGSYQENKPNPYVLDCSLAARMYCGDIDQMCREVMLTDIQDPIYDKGLKVFPSPSDGQFSIVTTGGFAKDTEIQLFDIYGKLALSVAMDKYSPMRQFDVNLENGYYILLVHNEESIISRPIIITK